MDNWHLTEEIFKPEIQTQRETLFTIGNGYLGTRGTFEEGFPGEKAVTLVNGVFDDAPVVFTELVNTPNWIHLKIYAGGEPLNLARSRVSAYRRDLDFGGGYLSRRVRWETASGGSLELQFERFTSLANEHLACVRLNIHSVDFEGPLEIRAGLPGFVDNDGIVHWLCQSQGQVKEQSAYLHLQTRSTHLDLVEAFHLSIIGERANFAYWDSQWSPEIIARLDLRPGAEFRAEKLVSIYTSRDTMDPFKAAVAELSDAVQRGYDVLREENLRAWNQDWEACNITIEGDDRADQAVRYNLYHLLIAASRRDDRISIPAKSLSGYGYRGHVFWDTEIFILPFFIFTRPHIAKNLLMYRFHTLPFAREKALSMGYEGAFYAWESASTGAETTPRWIIGPDGVELVRIWCGDIEAHISADVAYAVNQYCQVTGDDDFMRDFGAEIILDTARFWGSRVHLDEVKRQYVIEDVIGPDENHDHVDNNAYTNIMARWNLQAALGILDWLRKEAPQKARELEASLDLTPQRLNHWKDVIEKIYLGYDQATLRFEQFEGYYRLQDLDLAGMEPRYRSVQALLGVQDAQKVQVIKQPDVLMALILFPQGFNGEILRANWDYYTPRTDQTYGSSLGPAIQSIAAVRLGHLETAYQSFLHAALIDLEDIRGNGKDGIHAATAGGVWQAVVFGFAGIDPSGRSKPKGIPRLPAHWSRLAFNLVFHGRPYQVELPSQTPADPPGMQPNHTIQGVIFDLDGVLADTSELHYRAWKRLAEEEGIPFSRVDNEALRGIPRRESLLHLLNGRQVSEGQMDALMQRKNNYYLEFIDQLSPKDLLPGADEFLAELRQNDIRIAIGSASKNAEPVIERLGIKRWVDAISDGYSVHNQKPAPDLFLHAAGQLGLLPAQCVVFEDAAAGVEAALNAGMFVIGVGPPERVGQAHAVVPHLKGLHWDEIIQRLSKRPKGDED